MHSGSVPPQTPPPTIKLRPFQLSDVDAFLTWASDDRVTKFTRWDTFTSREQALEFLEQTVVPAPWFRAICLNSVDNHPIGSIFVRPGMGNDRCRGEIGYALAPEYWGRGVATAAVREAAAVVFDELPVVERLEGLVDAENFASQRVLEKSGFLKEGVLRKYFFLKGKTRDIIIYSFINDKINYQLTTCKK